MDPSLDLLHLQQAAQSQNASIDSHRHQLLASITRLVSKSVRRSRKVRTLAINSGRTSTQSSRDSSISASRSASEDASVPAATWKRRGQTPDMDDYLSMGQLENIWMYQDSHTAGVETPLSCRTYSFHDIPEAPTIVRHKREYDTENPSMEDLSPTNHSSVDEGAVDDLVTDEGVIVDGFVHPAFRPRPYLAKPDGMETSSRISKIRRADTTA